MARPPIPGDDPIVQREPQRRQVLVGRGDGRQALEDGADVIAEEADQPAEERRRIGRDDDRPVEASDQSAGDRERVGAGRRRLEDRDGIGGEVGPAGVAPRPGALEQDEARQVAERLGRIDRARAGDTRSGRRRSRSGALGVAGDSGSTDRDGDDTRRPPTGRRARGPRSTRAASIHRCGRETSGSPSGCGRPGRSTPSRTWPACASGHATIIEGDGPLVVGQGPVRTGVTVVVPRGPDDWREPVFAGCHRLNGNGELTGLEWVRESGQLTTPDRHHQHAQRRRRPRRAGRRVGPSTRPRAASWSLPVVGETYDGAAQRHQRLPRPARAPARRARRGHRRPGRGGQRRRRDGDGLPRVQGRDRDGVAGHAGRPWRPHGRRPGPGQLRQARLAPRRRRAGRCRDRRRRDPEPVRPGDATRRPRHPPPPGSGSIIVVVATDAPLLPYQLRASRAACRPGPGPRRRDGRAHSGDLFIAFATGNRLPAEDEDRARTARPTTCGRSATSSSTRCSTRPSRRPRRRSSTPWSPPRR